LLLALAGGIFGAICALGMSAVKISMLNVQTWSEIAFRFEPTPTVLTTSIVLSTIMGLIGGFLPALRAARVNPIEAMRA
jgi:putative ABC transport system permease protein